MLNAMQWEGPLKVNGEKFDCLSDAQRQFEEYVGDLIIELNFCEDLRQQQGEVKNNNRKYEVELPLWLAKKNKCPVVLKGTVLCETPKAIQFEGVGLIESPTCCCVCGRQLTNKVSKKLGIGPECANKMFGNHPYDDTLEKVMKETKFKVWLPKSQIELREIK